MTAAMIAQLLVAFGPGAIGLIQDLVAVWKRAELTPEEVLGICDRAQKSYDAYIAEARARAGTQRS